MAPVPTPDLWLYFLAVLAVILLPGMDMAYVMASSLAAGRRGAVSSVAGIATGGAIHVAVGATGMAALMVMFPALFRVLLVLGTLYLLWVGWGIYRSAAAAAGEAADATAQPATMTGVAVYRRAVTTCLLNPKAYAFMFALFPAFVRSDTRSLVAQALALGLITTATQVAVYGTVAALALRARAFLQRHQRLMARAMGLLLMGAAMVTASQAWAQTPATPVGPSITPSNPPLSRSNPMIPVFTPGPHEQGRGSFDFLVGDWRVESRKLVRPLDEDSPWETFSGTVHMEKLPGGLGNIDTFLAPDWRPNWLGMTLRLYNPQTGLWSLYWLSSRDAGLDSATGALTPPVVGRFDANGVGIFEGDDVINGRPLRVRYTWYDITPRQAKWQQAFSFDGGKTWKPNWFMVETRLQ